jgi:hypothetical protein
MDDGTECIQGVISLFWTHFGWDNSHLFAVEMPRRGGIPTLVSNPD